MLNTLIELPKPSKFEKLHGDLRKYWMQRKWNGNRSFATIDDVMTNLFSRRTSVVTHQKISYAIKFPHIVNEIKNLGLPFDTDLDGEMIWRPSLDKNEVFSMIKALTGCGDQEALSRQEKLSRLPEFMVFDIHHYAGQDLTSVPYRKKYEILQSIFKVDGVHIHLVENLAVDPEEGFLQAIQNGWEGFVYKDPDACEELGANDNVPRPRGFYKRKQPKEADVLVTGFNYGNGKNTNRVGSLICQAKKDGQLFHFCDCSGMSDALRDSLVTAKYPFVASIIYDELSEYGRALKPRLDKIHEDKTGTEEIFNLDDEE